MKKTFYSQNQVPYANPEEGDRYYFKFPGNRLIYGPTMLRYKNKDDAGEAIRKNFGYEKLPKGTIIWTLGSKNPLPGQTYWPLRNLTNPLPAQTYWPLRNLPNPPESQGRGGVSLQQGFEHPTEYLVYSLPAKNVGQTHFTCPVCQRQVRTLFTLAHDELESRYKFQQGDAACGYDLTDSIAKNDWTVVIPTRAAKK
jgi:hypothetical protein